MSIEDKSVLTMLGLQLIEVFFCLLHILFCVQTKSSGLMPVFVSLFVAAEELPAVSVQRSNPAGGSIQQVRKTSLIKHHFNTRLHQTRFVSVSEHKAES